MTEVEINEIAKRVVARFHKETTTPAGTPLFKRVGPTAALLAIIVSAAIREAADRE